MKAKEENIKPHRSLRTQFALIFILLVAAMLVIWWIINSLFLQRYYLKNKKQTLMEAYDRLNVLLEDTAGRRYRRTSATK